MDKSPVLARIVFEDRTSTPPIKEEHLLFGNRKMKVGRDPNSNDIFIDDGMVSRNHCEINAIMSEIDARHCPLIYLRDCGSANGIWVNGEKITSGQRQTRAWLLHNGDKISICSGKTIRVYQDAWPHLGFKLTERQMEETELFKNDFVVTDRSIGDGAFAVVYIACDVKTGRQLVCKVHDLDSLRLVDRIFLNRVEREALILSHLDHPNIMSYRTAIKTRHTLYTFAELATGGDLFSATMGTRGLDELNARWVTRQIVRGVAYLHAKGVAHRDLKLENILLDDKPELGHRIMISDFGYAATSQRRMRSFTGTPLYQAPEFRRSSLNWEHDLTVDMWSIGIIVLELLNTEGISLIREIQKAVVQSEVDDILVKFFTVSASEAFEPVSKKGVQFVSRCLRIDPTKRMTAAQAWTHPWLCTPAADHDLFSDLERTVDACWEPQTLMLPPIRNLATFSRNTRDPVNTSQGLTKDAGKVVSQHPESQEINNIPKPADQFANTGLDKHPHPQLAKCKRKAVDDFEDLISTPDRRTQARSLLEGRPHKRTKLEESDLADIAKAKSWRRLRTA